MIHLKRARDVADESDGLRYLVERLWPRGVKKAEVHLDGWLKDVAPSTALRKWFAHDPSKWTEFQRRYFAELNERPSTWSSILEAARHGAVTLIYSSRDAEHNNALALKLFLEQRLQRRSRFGTVERSP
jgi:uncharacterized protein YeaO (DUF488 family)